MLSKFTTSGLVLSSLSFIGNPIINEAVDYEHSYKNNKNIEELFNIKEYSKMTYSNSEKTNKINNEMIFFEIIQDFAREQVDLDKDFSEILNNMINNKKFPTKKRF